MIIQLIEYVNTRTITTSQLTC